MQQNPHEAHTGFGLVPSTSIPDRRAPGPALQPGRQHDIDFASVRPPVTPQRLPKRANWFEGQLATNCKKLKPRYPASGSAGCASRVSGRHWSVSVTHRFLRRGEIRDLSKLPKRAAARRRPPCFGGAKARALPLRSSKDMRLRPQ
jgi:hypothetical protein